MRAVVDHVTRSGIGRKVPYKDNCCLGLSHMNFKKESFADKTSLRSRARNTKYYGWGRQLSRELLNLWLTGDYEPPRRIARRFNEATLLHADFETALAD